MQIMLVIKPTTTKYVDVLVHRQNSRHAVNVETEVKKRNLFNFYLIRKQFLAN